jgi:opacity protein-like surface antigen
MFKKMLIASAVLVATSSVVFAGHSYKGEYKGEQAAPCPTYSFAAGPYLGLSLGSTVNGSGAPTYFQGVTGTLSAGWGMMASPMFYLAGELFGSGTASVKNFSSSPTAAANQGAKETWSWGLSFIPGFMVTDHVLLYGRLGGQQTRFKDAGVNKTGWHVGLGGQTNVYQNWDLRGEYVLSQYRSVSSQVGRVVSNKVNIGVVYKFV